MKREEFHHMMSDRYYYDWGQCSTKNGFAQVDTGQDASYFGTWANPERLIIVCYCEGDVTISRCESRAEFIKEIRELVRWNEESGHGFKGIDAMMVDSIKEGFIGLGLGGLLH